MISGTGVGFGMAYEARILHEMHDILASKPWTEHSVRQLESRHTYAHDVCAV